MAVNKNLEKGHRLQFEDLEAKKPKGYGIDAYEFEKMIGRKISRDLNKWEFLNWDDLKNDSF